MHSTAHNEATEHCRIVGLHLLWNCDLSLDFESILKRITLVNLELLKDKFWREKILKS